MRSSKHGSRGSSDRHELVEELNRLMAEETEACLHYFQMRFRLRDNDYADAQPFFDIRAFIGRRAR